MKPLRIGALGAATITEHGIVIPARELDDVVVQGVAARDPARAADYAERHDIPQAFDSYEALIASPEIDAVYIALPNSLHHRWTVEALRAGKHVLCEKPLASNATEALEMARVADSSGLCLAEAVHYRYHPMAARIRSIVESGRLGELERIEARMLVPIPPGDIRREFTLAGGCVMDPGCYPLQMVRFFSGETPEVCEASASLDAAGLDVEAQIRLRLPSGASAQVRVSIDHPGVDGEFKIIGSAGTLVATNLVLPHIRNQIVVTTASDRSAESVPGEPTFLGQLRAFAAWTRGGPPMPTDGLEGVENMHLIDSVYRSAGLPLRGS